MDLGLLFHITFIDWKIYECSNQLRLLKLYLYIFYLSIHIYILQQIFANLHNLYFLLFELQFFSWKENF